MALEDDLVKLEQLKEIDETYAQDYDCLIRKTNNSISTVKEVIGDLTDAIGSLNTPVDSAYFRSFSDKIETDEYDVRESGILFLGVYEDQQFPDGFTYNGIDQISSIASKYSKADVEKNLEKLMAEGWKVPDSDITNNQQIVEEIASEDIRVAHMRQVHRRITKATFAEEMEHRRAVMTADIDSSASELMKIYHEKLLKYPQVFHLNDGEDEEMAELEIAEEALVSHCAISRQPIRQAARATCNHIFDYDSLIKITQGVRGRIRCPQPGCNQKFAMKDITKDTPYQLLLDRARENGEI